MQWVADNFMSILQTIVGAAAVYAAIRGDLATLHERTGAHQKQLDYLIGRVDSVAESLGRRATDR